VERARGRRVIGGLLSAYRIDAELGSGGMGTVYKAEVSGQVPGLRAGASVALKVIHSNLLAQPGFFQRFLREAQVGQRVQHDNVVRTFACDATLHEGVQKNFLVMEYVEGQTLRDLLKELGRVPEELCRHIAREVTKGLAAIHAAGIVHRDVKPENVLITEEQVVKIMDLGVARLQDEAIKLSQTGAFLGSVEYAAPEQFMGAGEGIDGRTDLHALGLILYELATGQNPYRDEDARKVLRKVLDEEPRRAGEINPQISPFFEEVVHTLLSKDREQRFVDAPTLTAILEAGEEGDWWKERAKALRIETQQPLRRVRVPRETALYGRDAEVERLLGLFAKAKAGNGQVLLVEGEAGIGKTRLVDELVGRLRQEGEDLNFLFGAYPPGGAATAAGAFSTAYREQFGKEGLQETLQQYLTDTPLLTPAFAALLKGDATPTGAEPLTKDSLQTVFVHATRALAAERPTIVLIDDLHFAPEDGRSLFAALAMALPEHRVLLVGTARRGLSEEWIANLDRLDQFSRIGLDRLGPKDLGRLVLDVFRSQRLADELGFQIVMKSDGNPYFVFEIIRGLREGKFIAQTEDGSWVSTQVIKDIKIPSSVMDLIEARLADVSDEDRELLDVAACCGAQFDASLVADTLGLKRIPALRALGRIEKQHHLVRATGPVFAFDHYQVQEALYKGLSEPLRKEYHGALGEALEEREGAGDKEHADVDGAILVQLCEHFLRGIQPRAAMRYLDAALTYLEENYLNDQVLSLVDRTLGIRGLLEGARRIETLLRKDGRLALMGRPKDQEAVLAEARRLAEAGKEEALLARVECAFGSLLLSTSRHQEARRHLEVAHSQAVAAGDVKTAAQASLAMGRSFFQQGAFEAARPYFERAHEGARAIADRTLEGSAINMLAGVAYSLGGHDQSRSHLEEALGIARDLGASALEATLTGNLGLVFDAMGMAGQATVQKEEALRIYREVGNRGKEAETLSLLADSRLRFGRGEEARPLFVRALHMAGETGNRALEASVSLGLALLAEREGHVDEEERLQGDSLALSRELGLKAGVASSLVGLGGMLIRRGREEGAMPLLEEAIGLARELNIPAVGVEALCWRALRNSDDIDPALEAYRSSEARLDHAVRMRCRHLLWQATGDRQHLAAAHDLLMFFVEHAPEEYRGTTLTNVPLHREITQAWKEHGS